MEKIDVDEKGQNTFFILRQQQLSKSYIILLLYFTEKTSVNKKEEIRSTLFNSKFDNSNFTLKIRIKENCPSYTVFGKVTSIHGFRDRITPTIQDIFQISIKNLVSQQNFEIIDIIKSNLN
eukprot:TRINITY_DN4454_c0_g3_i4.p9 TRINITY_DN4454_c0_g3~~TRINITY_DN4454_c0_g3_i4.p9  ORF type:complete len:121 (-),score=3.08 TRINITY_DN4454_c0_g3_i4:1527-1889(-)